MEDKLFDPKTKVLVVDDMNTMRLIVSKTLKDLGYTDVTVASDGAQAWEILSRPDCPIRLVVSDWNMPNMMGIDLLRNVRSHPTLNSIPFVLLTAENEVSQIKDAVVAGVDNYILKPFSPATFKEKLGIALKKRQGSKAA